MTQFRTRQLLATTGIIAILCGSGAALAQGVPASPANQAPTANDAQTGAPGGADQAADNTAAALDDAETIVVTGSLIRNPNLVASQPVLVTTADTIQLTASNVAEQVLRDLPGITPNVGSAVNNGNAGASFVDLKGLGPNRNLVLLDGQRIVPANLFPGAVDLNNIPLALVQRVDVLTGGAVTTYGADAITGVINFVLMQDFTGVDLQLSSGITQSGDGWNFRGDLTIGGNFADGRGNAVLSIGYQKSDAVFQGSRSYSIDNIDSFSGEPGGSGTAIPSRLTGLRPIDPVTGLPSTNPAVANGNLQLDPQLGYARGLYAPFNFNPYNVFQTPFERFNIFGQARYEVSDAVEFYARGLYSNNTVISIIAPSGSFGAPVEIPLSNPFLPAGVRSQLCASNIGAAGTYVPRFTPEECAAAALATNPADPAYRVVRQVTDAEGNIIDPGTALARRTTELGSRISDFRTNIFDYRGGLRGQITDNINWDVSGSYGQSERVGTVRNFTLTSRVQQSLLATNPTTCLDPSNGCTPVDWFGATGIDPSQASFLTADSTSTIRTTLLQARGLISGSTGLTIPAAADAVQFALGAEYRKYTGQQASDLLAKTPGELGGAGGAAPDIKGGYDVREVYGELILPIVQDKPFFEDLTIEGGLRYSDYKVDAPGSPGFDTLTWKAGGTWSIGGGFKVRGNYSRAVRAPNINELFFPETVGLTNLAIDPCAGIAPVTNPTLGAVCIAQGAPASALGSIENPTAGQANARASGNTNLRPETAYSWTAGIVFQPDFVQGLSLTVDYYDIIVRNAITAPTPGDAIGACFNNITAASVNDPACLSIRRDPAAGALSGDPSTTLGLNLPTTNSGRLHTNGIDVTLAWSRDLGFANLGIVGNANFSFSSEFQSIPGGVNRDCVGYYSSNCSFTGSLIPPIQTSLRTTLGFDVFDVSLLWRYIDGLEYEPRQFAEELANAAALGCTDPAGADPDGCVVEEQFRNIRAYNIFDLTGRFNVAENLQLVATVNNLFDTKPPLVGSTIGSTAFNSGNTYPSTYDALGRRYTMQVILKF